jgi:hypothetical protein
MRNIITVIVILAIFCHACKGQSDQFIYSQVADHPEPRKTAPNISIGDESIWVCYPDAEFILSYCGEVSAEMSGKVNTFDASVIQIESGIWLATARCGDYVKVNTCSGITNASLDGEFRVYKQ